MNSSVKFSFIILVSLLPLSLFSESPENILDFLTIVPMEDGNWILECDDTLAGDVVLPSSYNGTPITKIYANAFEDCDLITSIVVPEGILEIQGDAFKSCSNLSYISLPDSLSTIGDAAFQYCSSLDNVTIPNGISIIPHMAFWECGNLKSIVLPNNLEEIGDSAFWGCGFVEFTIPDGIKLNDGIFSSCYDLRQVNLPSDLVVIPTFLFFFCTSLESITIPEGVERINTYAFQNCSNLTSINLPNTLLSIAYNAFKNCSSLETISLPQSLTSIGGGFYSGADGAFEGCSSLRSIVIPPSLTIMGKYTFRDCASLEYVYFEGDNHFASSEFPFLGSNPKIYFNENTNGWDDSPFSLVWEMIEKPVAMVTFNNQINEMEISYEEVSQNYVLYSSDSLIGPYTPVENQSIQVTTGANGQITKVFNDTVTTSKFYKLVLNLDDYHSN
ncbi:MAG: leucine-rich repeat domain-containing protein [Opitutales bacterium]